MWILQFSVNEYDQQGYYSTKVWKNKPSLVELAGKPLEQLDEVELVNLVSLFKGEEVNRERLIETKKDGTIPYTFD